MRRMVFGAMILWLMALGGVAHSLTVTDLSADEPELVLESPEATNAQSELISALALSVADLDGDGIVGGSDFVQLRGCILGDASKACEFADFDQDSAIGASDLAFFGRALGTALITSPVPEPSTLVLAAGGLVALGWLRSRI